MCADTLVICHTACHSAIVGKFSTRKKRRRSDNMPAWDVFLSDSHSLSPPSLALYLDPGDEQENVCSTEKPLARNIIEKTRNSKLD